MDRLPDIDPSAERDPLRALVPFTEALKGLLGADDPADDPVGMRERLRALSNATAADVQVLRADWPAAPAARRRAVVAALKALADDDFYVSFKAVFTAILDDDDPVVRATAVGGLWEASDPRLLDRYSELLAHDPDPGVKAAAAEAIGPYIERAELDAIDRARVAPALALVLAAARDDAAPIEVRAKAVASAGWSETPDAVSIIASALGAGETELAVAALTAIGRSADPRWRNEVLAHLEEVHPAVQASAAAAAGLLGLKAAILPLARVAQEAAAPVRKTAIEALGEIGGYQATLALELLAEAESDEELLVVIDNAIEAASLGELEIEDLQGEGAAEPGGADVADAAGEDDDILRWLGDNADPEDLDGWLDEDELDDEDDVIALGRVLRRAEDVAARGANGGFEADDLLAEDVDGGGFVLDDDVEVDRDAWAWDEDGDAPSTKA